MNHNILLITYHYPPSMAVGGLRLANFARFLPANGWQPYVLTINDRYLEQVDRQRLIGLEYVPVFKSSMLPTVSDLYLAVRKWMNGNTQKSTGSDQSDNPQTVTAKTGGSGNESIKHRLKRYIFSLLLSLPDGERNWIIPAVLNALRIIRRERITCILTSSPPYSVHLIGLVLKWVTDVCWVADFRDPWITGSRKRLYYTCQLSMAIERRMERHVLRKADAVIGNTSALTDTLRRTHHDLGGRKFIQLPNGFNPDAFVPFQGLPKFERFTLAYTGSLYFGRSPEPVFASLKNLIDGGYPRSRDICMKLVGHCNHLDGRPIDEVIRQYELNGIVEVIPPVSYREAMEIVARSHIALLLAPDQPYQIPAKAYDYAGIGTPVLALAGDGATSDMVRSTATGVVFTPGDIQGITAFLSRSLKNPAQANEEPNERILNSLDIRKIVKELVNHLDDVCLLTQKPER